ncbi:MAG: hypothetical protein LBG30_06120, partial [Odoribacteraceae bacterium]|nr:hypothetical protein [Odoribacteraceae bacterium]
MKWWKQLEEKHIFSLIEVWQDELEREDLTFDEFSTLLFPYARVQEWLAEDSGFLSAYSREEQEEIRAQVEARLYVAYAWMEAVQLIRDGEWLDYISMLLYKLEASGYLYDRERRILVLSALFRWSPEAIEIPARESIRTLLLSEQRLLPESFDIFLERQLLFLDTRDFPYMTRTLENMSRMEGAMRLMAAKTLVSKNNSLDICARASFYRLLYMLSGSHPGLIRDNALRTLLFRSAETKFTLSDLISLDIPEFIDKVLSHTSLASAADAQARVFRGRGQVMLKEGVIYLSPENPSLAARESEVQNSAAIPLRLLSSKDENFSAGASIESLSIAWRRAYEDFQPLQKKKKRLVVKERPNVGARVKIQVKNLHHANPLLLFVRIVDDHFEGDGILHARQITRVKLNSLGGIFKPGDRMMATVVESTPSRLSFSIIDELDAIVGTRHHAGELTSALLIAQNRPLSTWVSE